MDRLRALYERIQSDPAARNDRMGSIFVPGVGTLTGPRPVLIGEAPGREEELRREPFVGQAGRNLDMLLDEIGWSRERVFITNLVKYRPVDSEGGNRSPTLAEARYALAYLLEELGFLSPSLVVCLGLSVARTLLEIPGLKMSQANGSVFHKYDYRLIVTYHPSPFNFRVPSKNAALRSAFSGLNDLCPFPVL